MSIYCKVRNVYALLSCTVDPMVSPFVSLVFDLVTYFLVSWNPIGCFYSRRCILALATLCSFDHSEFGRLIVDIVFILYFTLRHIQNGLDIPDIIVSFSTYFFY